MRMAALATVLLAVLCAAVVGAGDGFSNTTRERRATPMHHPHRVLTEEDLDSAVVWKRSHWREMQSVLRAETSSFSECCPSVVEMVAPKGGRTPSGLFVELFGDGENRQQLYELSCAKDVVGKPCRFIDARLYNQSRCVQKYSYSYALVRQPEATDIPHHHRHRREGLFAVQGSEGWSIDYVRVRAGCECQVTPPKRKTAHRKRQERHRLKKKNKRMDYDDDDT